ncbi:MAG TPA: hypothetical protein VK021_08735 [Flavobacteriaceae bacterium]|nr:hypothetical protein [Flavobacteriaceae bacterium]
MDGIKKTYKPYGIKVRGKKSLADNTLTDLELIAFVQYKPVFNKSRLEKAIKKQLSIWIRLKMLTNG